MQRGWGVAGAGRIFAGSAGLLIPPSLRPPPPCPAPPRPAAKQQHALLCFLAMLGGVLALNATRFAEQWPRAKWAVLCLAAAIGLVGVALQLQGGTARPPQWMQALPWAGAPGGGP